MDIHSKNGLVFIVQVDHLSGESIGQVIDRFYDAGASNVQVIPAITKKNRPSYVFLIDGRPDCGDAVESVIVTELGTGGWHRIDTTHRYLHSRMVTRDVAVVGVQDRFTFTLLGKRLDSGVIRPEHDNVAALKDRIAEELHQDIGYPDLYARILSVLIQPESSILYL